MEYKLIRQPRRKKLLLIVNPLCEVIVKAGVFSTQQSIDEFVNSKSEWIRKQQQYFKNKYHTRISVTQEQRNILKKELLPEMTELVEKYSEIMDVTPKSIKITVAEKRWGSCSGRQTICFSYRCAFLSQRCKEYIVIHELCHLKQMNHSQMFYQLVAKYMPEYREVEKELGGYYIHLQQ